MFNATAALRRRGLITTALLTVLVAACPRALSAQTAPDTGPVAFVPLDPQRSSQVDCDADLTRSVCRVKRPWTEAALRARWAQAGASAWVDNGDEVTFVYEGSGPAVDVCCGVQYPMSPLRGTNLWVLTVRLEGADEAALEYRFFVRDPAGPRRMSGATAPPRHELRGPRAPARQPSVATLQGTIRKDSVWSEALGRWRGVSIYVPPGASGRLPVLYLADGGGVPQFAPFVEAAILAGHLRPVLLVGAASLDRGPGAAGPDSDLRSEEYLFDYAPGNVRYLAHERFFVDELAAWAERVLGASAMREERGVGGFSNGGSFAVAMGLRHPERFGYVLGYSAGWKAGLAFVDAGPRPRFSLVAGRLEPGFLRNTSQIADSLRAHGYDVSLRTPVAGHDLLMWQEAMPQSLMWALGPPRAN